MPHRQASDWTGKVYPKDHDTTLDHPGRITPPGYIPMPFGLTFTLSEWQAIYTAARANETFTGFMDYIHSSESPRG